MGGPLTLIQHATQRAEITAIRFETGRGAVADEYDHISAFQQAATSCASVA